LSLLFTLDPRRSLRARFAGVLGGCGLAFAMAGALLVGAYEHAQVQQGVGQALRREAELLDRTLGIILQERLQLVRQLAAQPVLSSGLMDAGEMRLLLEQLRTQQTELTWLAITNERGQVRVATGALLEGQNLADEPWFAEGLKQPWIGERHGPGRLGGQVPLTRDGLESQFVDLAAPLIDFQGRRFGVLVARLNWGWLEALHLALHDDGQRAPGTDSLVLDRRGLVGIGPPALLGRPLDLPGLAALQGGAAPQVLAWPDGQRYLTALSRAGGQRGPGAELTVVVRQQEGQAFAAADALTHRLVGFGAAAALAFMALSIWLAGRIAKPVQALSAAAARMAAGEPPGLPPVPARRRDEVVELNRAMVTLHDELQQRLAAQQRSASRFEQLFQGAPVAIYLSVDGALTMANAACLQLFGASHLDQLLGKRTAELVHPDERPLLARRIARLRELHAGQQAVPVVEHRILRLDGSVRDVEITALPMAVDGTVGVHVALRDITEGKRSAQALAASEARLQLVLSGTGAAVWDWTIGSQTPYLSPTWALLLGLGDGPLPASRAQWLSHVHADDRDALVQRLQAMAAGQIDRAEIECRVHAGSGEPRSLLARAFLVRDAQGQPARLVGSATDISEIRAAQCLLQQREAMLQQTSRMAHVGGWALDLATEQAEWTAEVSRMYGLAEDTAPTLALMRQSYPPEVWARLEALVMQAARQGTAFDVEVPLSLPSPQPRWMRVMGRPLRRAAQPARIEGMVQDVTDRRRAEEAVRELNAQLEVRVLERTAQLHAANAELDSFAYAVSHDLRAPLRAMSGFSQALLEDHGARLDAQARGYLDQITQASQRMGALIDGLLTLSRSTRGELRSDEVNLSALADRALAELRRTEPARVLRADIAPDLLVHGDARMLDAVVRNLIGNAWKYTGRSADPWLQLHAVWRGGRRWIEVADNGAGFDMAHAGRLFKAFARLHRQDEFTGIGIGLATVQRIISRHGGEIEASGVPGQGAQFRFWLPDTAPAGDNVRP